MAMSGENITDVVVVSDKGSDRACTERASQDCERGNGDEVDKLNGSH